MGATTIRVTTATRDRLVRIRDADGTPGVSIEDVLQKLLDEHAKAQLRRQLYDDARHARNNTADRAEVQAVQADLDEISAW